MNPVKTLLQDLTRAFLLGSFSRKYIHGALATSVYYLATYIAKNSWENFRGTLKNRESLAHRIFPVYGTAIIVIYSDKIAMDVLSQLCHGDHNYIIMLKLTCLPIHVSS